MSNHTFNVFGTTKKSREKKKNNVVAITSIMMSVTLVGAILLLPAMTNTAQAAAPALREHFRGQFAQAFGSTIDGNIETDVFLEANTGFQETFVEIFQIDTSTDTVLMDFIASAPLNQDEFTIDKTLNSAALSTTVTGTDFVSGTEKTVTLDVSWTGEGRIVTENAHFHLSAGELIINDNFIGKFMDASASISTSGDITVNIEDASGLLGNVREGTVVIER